VNTLSQINISSRDKILDKYIKKSEVLQGHIVKFTLINGPEQTMPGIKNYQFGEVLLRQSAVAIKWEISSWVHTTWQMGT
jgi:hypothetical protein